VLVFLTVFFVSLFGWEKLMVKVVVVDLIQFLPEVAVLVVLWTHLVPARGFPFRHPFLIHRLSQ
jgi:hypothetical protein